LASLLSAIADGVSLLGCAPQCNANIRPFAIALHFALRLWTTYSWVLNSHRHSVVPDPHVNVKIALAELPSKLKPARASDVQTVT
jgi:hypothetical protein